MIKSISSKLWAALTAAFFLVGALITAYLKGGKARANEIKAETEEAAREYQNAGSEALIKGLEKESQVKHEKVDSDTFVKHFK